MQFFFDFASQLCIHNITRDITIRDHPQQTSKIKAGKGQIWPRTVKNGQYWVKICRQRKKMSTWGIKMSIIPQKCQCLLWMVPKNDITIQMQLQRKTTVVVEYRVVNRAEKSGALKRVVVILLTHRQNNLTLTVFRCSFLIFDDLPHILRQAHLMRQKTLFGVGMMLKGGGTVPPSSK